MSRRLATLAILALVLGGCAMPTWVPWLGKKKDQPTPPAVAAEASEASEPPEADKPAESPRPARPSDDSVTDRIVAVVNNDAITLGELQEAIQVYRYENREAKAPSDQLIHQFLTRMIDGRLQLQEADREKIVIDDAEVEEELSDRIRKLNIKTREEFEQIIKAQGLGIEAIRKKIRDGLKVNRLIRRKVTARISVTDAEIARYLEANRQKLETGLGYHARHILVTPEGSSDSAWEAARIKAELLRTQLLQGADFAEIARQHSKDATAKEGGDLGTLKRGELAQDIEAEILSLSPGEISKPYRSALGYHIFKLESKDTLEGEGLQRAQAQIREILFREKYEARLDAWLKEIKRRAVIEIRL